MARKLNVAVIFGGKSGEHEVSLLSVAAVLKNLDKNKYRITQVGITKEGRWISGPQSLKLLRTGQNERIEKDSLEIGALHGFILNKKIDIIFPVLHGPFGEDGTIQGLLELMSIPYVGSGVLGSAVAMDKITQKRLCEADNIKIVDWIWLNKKEWSWIKKNKVYFNKWLKGVEGRLGYPLFIKPSNLGSSVGISRGVDRDSLIKGINLASQYDSRIVIEQAVEEVMDIEIGLLGNNDPRVSAIGAIVPKNSFYDYAAKYIQNDSQEIIPVKLPSKIKKEIERVAVQVFKLLDASGLARADFFLNKINGEYNIYFNELNTMPGFTPISMYAKLWRVSGVSYNRLLDSLIKLAQARYRDKKQLLTSYKMK